jgi:dihydrofolate synthase / folylpolyglutamate synthase
MSSPLSYPAALEWLFARTRAGDARSAERSRVLLAELGRPDLSFPAIHVLGTNGKGSVCAMLAAGLEASGGVTGRFTSPHLVDFRERIVVNSEMISEAEILEFIQWAQEHASSAAFFDLTFVMGMQYFQRQGVEIAIVEAGVGGSGDASNALERVQLTILTNVDYDHEAVIGVGPEESVLKNIALEKAGAIKPNVPVVTAVTGDALEIVRRVARERTAPLHELSLENALFQLPHAPRLRGTFQLENARLAVAALRLLGHGEHTVEAALNARWAGRLEVLQRGDATIWLDGAHNPAGAAALASSVSSEAREHGAFALLFGAMGRKNVPALLEPLLPLSGGLHFVSPGVLGADPAALQKQFGGTAHESLETALHVILETEQRVLIAGSLYLVGAARAALMEMGFVEAIGE